DEKDVVRIGHHAADGEQYLVHSYQRIQDKEENYIGVNEYVTNVKQVINWYIKQTNQKLVPNKVAEKDRHKMNIDGISGASQKSDEKNNIDALSGASKTPF